MEIVYKIYCDECSQTTIYALAIVFRDLRSSQPRATNLNAHFLRNGGETSRNIRDANVESEARDMLKGSSEPCLD